MAMADRPVRPVGDGDNTCGPSKRTSTVCANELVARDTADPVRKAGSLGANTERLQMLRGFEKGQVPTPTKNDKAGASVEVVCCIL